MGREKNITCSWGSFSPSLFSGVNTLVYVFEILYFIQDDNKSKNDTTNGQFLLPSSEVGNP